MVCNRYSIHPNAYEIVVTVEAASVTLIYDVAVAFAIIIETLVPAM
jgi:hypothetical protein